MTASTSLRCAAALTLGTRSITPRGAVGVGLLALVVSCGESPSATGPSASSPETSLVAAHQAAAPALPADVVIMHRTTVVAGHGNTARLNRNVTERITGVVRRAPKKDGPIPEPTQADFSNGVPPRPIVALPARTETAMCSALPAWSRVEKTGAGRTMTVSGTGDAPASRIAITTDDGTGMTVERTWVRTARTWELARQVTTIPDKRLRDEVVYEHQSVSGGRSDRALPIVACAGARGPGLLTDHGSRGFYPPHGSTFTARLFPLSDAVASYDCGGGGLGGGDCFAEQNAVYLADLAVVNTAAIAAFSCIYVVVVAPPVCAAASLAYVTAVAALALTQRALTHCLAQRGRTGFQTMMLPRDTGFAGTLAYADPGGGTGRSTDIRPRPPMLAEGCGGGNAYGCGWVDVEISYDGGDTWTIIGSEWVCAYDM